MNKHTPGPWKFSATHQCSGDAWFVITDNDGRGPIMEVGGKDENGQIAEAKYLITNPQEIEANARLIAAAPEMLAELEKIANNCEACEGFGIVEYQPSGIDGYLPTGDANFVTEDCPHCATVRAIIAKATGES